MYHELNLNSNLFAPLKIVTCVCVKMLTIIQNEIRQAAQYDTIWQKPMYQACFMEHGWRAMSHSLQVVCIYS